MPPKNILSRETVIEKAFEILRKEGFQAVSARNIAKELGVSTMPIYVYFKTMDELKDILIRKAFDLLYSYQVKQRSGRPFYDMGLGYIAFAREEKRLFQEILQNQQMSTNDLNERFHFSDLVEEMRQDSDLVGLDDADFENILMKMWIFVHGLAGMISQDALPFRDDESIAGLIEETGGAVIMFEHLKKNVPETADKPQEKTKSEYSVKELFMGMESHFNPKKAAGVNAVYQYHITDEPDGNWVIEVRDQKVKVYQGVKTSVDLEFWTDFATHADIISGKTSGVLAYMTGKLKMQGDFSLANKFAAIFQNKR